ncbi:DJ-1/PfpI family protein [Hoeflea poritis]|uniref:DJ-1/PfpI family protein n=1 Tax=Hoeflea poritis TaxID=2993659 RepID=A0ABT4VKM7_9HYPH|nr:DJ-1/PfpI family protein [Hoeflea poritis]MDA4845255.1 DJ-1/PfpI family protein [Hoeflea poritis]
MGTFKTVGVVVFDGIERLDFEGPLGVLGWAARHSEEPASVLRVSKDGRPVKDHLSGTTINVEGSLVDFDGFDLLVVPGGDTGQFADDGELIAGVHKLGTDSRVVASVCTGAFLVAGAGLANGKSIATHWMSHPRFESRFPNVRLAKDKRYVCDGKLWSSAGISAGIDMTLNLVTAEYGEIVSKKCQGLLEYFPEPPWTREEVSEALGS